jgi:hypothetical protein
MKRTKQLYVLAGVLVVVGAIVLIVGYSGIRGEADVALQLPYIVSGGLGGLFLLGMGVGLFLAGSLGEVRTEQSRLEATVSGLAGEVRTLLDHAEIETVADDSSAIASRTSGAR